eukprot:2689864-Karenia_brevis.AAC.1
MEDKGVKCLSPPPVSLRRYALFRAHNEWLQEKAAANLRRFKAGFRTHDPTVARPSRHRQDSAADVQPPRDATQVAKSRL